MSQYSSITPARSIHTINDEKQHIDDVQHCNKRFKQGDIICKWPTTTTTTTTAATTSQPPKRKLTPQEILPETASRRREQARSQYPTIPIITPGVHGDDWADEEEEEEEAQNRNNNNNNNPSTINIEPDVGQAHSTQPFIKVNKFHTKHWVFYPTPWVRRGFGQNHQPNIGKWNGVSTNRNRVEQLSHHAISQGIAREVKFENDEKGIVSIFLDFNDWTEHKKVLRYMVKNGILAKIKDGTYKNVNLLLEYGKNGRNIGSELKLEYFLNLYDGKWFLD